MSTVLAAPERAAHVQPDRPYAARGKSELEAEKGGCFSYPSMRLSTTTETGALLPIRMDTNDHSLEVFAFCCSPLDRLVLRGPASD